MRRPRRTRTPVTGTPTVPPAAAGTITGTTIMGTITTPMTAQHGHDHGQPRAQARALMASHLPLLVWLSPSFPVGAFAYSHGLEWAQEAGDVTDAATLQAWLDDLLAFGAARNDAVLFAEAYARPQSAMAHG
jgi:hypothetical protein